jgi:hypothetical protein
MLLCQVEGSGDGAVVDSEAVKLRWVRTAEGWERPDNWYLSEIEKPRLHPVVVGVGQLMLSVLGLLAFERTLSLPRAAQWSLVLSPPF